MEKEKVKALRVRKFQGFCDIFNGVWAMAILLILFWMRLDRGNI